MLRSELVAIVGEHFVSVDETDKLVYSTDWSWMPQMWLDRGHPLRTPDFIVHPGSAEEISEIMRVANKYRIPVVPYGGGSGTQGGALPIHGGIVVDTKRLDKIIEIDEKSLTVTAQAGINGTHLEWALNEKGLTFPHYQASTNCATPGGNLAPRGSGTISTKYGKAEDMVLSMQIVLPNGDIIRTPPVPKHAAGPDWFRLFLGAEGTFGIITEATMQVDYMPEVRLFRGLLFDDLSKALEAGRLMMTRRLDPRDLGLVLGGEESASGQRPAAVEPKAAAPISVDQSLGESSADLSRLIDEKIEGLGTDTVPTASAPHVRKARISAGVSKLGPV